MVENLDSEIECKECGKTICKYHILPLGEPNPIQVEYYTVAPYDAGHHTGCFCEKCYLNEVKRQMENGEFDLRVQKSLKNGFYTETNNEK